jgi:hypothetical protein
MVILSQNKKLQTPCLEKILIKDENGKVIRHRYELNGQKIKGVTTYLGHLRTLMPNDYYLERGTWAHLICAQIDKKSKLLNMWREWIDDLSKSNPENSHLWRSWFNGYLQFQKDHNLEGGEIHNEIPLASQKLWVAATLDKIIPDDKPLRGVLLYLTSSDYKVYNLKYSEKHTSKFQLLLNDFKKVKWFVDFRREHEKEKED